MRAPREYVIERDREGFRYVVGFYRDGRFIAVFGCVSHPQAIAAQRRFQREEHEEASR